MRSKRVQTMTRNPSSRLHFKPSSVVLGSCWKRERVRIHRWHGTCEPSRLPQHEHLSHSPLREGTYTARDISFHDRREKSCPSAASATLTWTWEQLMVICSTCLAQIQRIQLGAYIGYLPETAYRVVLRFQIPMVGIDYMELAEMCYNRFADYYI
jgi:hypothetical protein